jgi:hypothetical protein
MVFARSPLRCGGLACVAFQGKRISVTIDRLPQTTNAPESNSIGVMWDFTVKVIRVILRDIFNVRSIATPIGFGDGF